MCGFNLEKYEKSRHVLANLQISIEFKNSKKIFRKISKGNNFAWNSKNTENVKLLQTFIFILLAYHENWSVKNQRDSFIVSLFCDTFRQTAKHAREKI